MKKGTITGPKSLSCRDYCKVHPPTLASAQGCFGFILWAPGASGLATPGV